MSESHPSPWLLLESELLFSFPPPSADESELEASEFESEDHPLSDDDQLLSDPPSEPPLVSLEELSPLSLAVLGAEVDLSDLPLSEPDVVEPSELSVLSPPGFR